MNKERLWNTKCYHSRASPLKKKNRGSRTTKSPLSTAALARNPRFHHSRVPLFFQKKPGTLEPPNLPLTLLLRPIILDSQSAPHKRPPRQPRSRPVSAYHERPPRQSRSRQFSHVTCFHGGSDATSLRHSVTTICVDRGQLFGCSCALLFGPSVLSVFMSTCFQAASKYVGRTPRGYSF